MDQQDDKHHDAEGEVNDVPVVEYAAELFQEGDPTGDQEPLLSSCSMSLAMSPGVVPNGHSSTMFP